MVLFPILVKENFPKEIYTLVDILDDRVYLDTTIIGGSDGKKMKNGTYVWHSILMVSLFPIEQ